jgi:glycosyltransferase involved in cell wall biosynthesis
MSVKPEISIVTATYNSEKVIERLAESLINQTDKRFEWIVADGGSTDNTLKFLERYRDALKLRVISKSDFGIYDAINKCIRYVDSNYYVVAGSDDFFYDGAVSSFLHEIKGGSGCDIYTFRLKLGDKIVGVRGGSVHLNKQFSYISSHSIATVFRKELHDRFGFYSRNFPIAADQNFILTCISGGARIFESQEIVGYFSKDGVSSCDVLGSLTESYRVQAKFYNKWLSTFVFLLKLAKNFRKI